MPGTSEQLHNLRQIVAYVFGSNVRAAAHAARVQQPTLQRILMGGVQEPKISTLQKLADRFGVSLAWLMGESDLLWPGKSQRRDIEALSKFLGAPDPDQLPVWWNLLTAYHRRAQRDDRKWLEAVKAKTSGGRRIIEEYGKLRRVDQAHALFLACLQPALKSGKPVPDDFLREWRLELEAETMRLRCAVRELRRLGEGPAS